MNVWFTSDLHFGHENVIQFCKRPFDNVQLMNDALIRNYCQLVQPNDIVWFLGDLTLSSYKEAERWIKDLPGRRYLVKGNHDKFSNGQYRRLGFEEVFEEVKLKLFGERILLSHFPYRPGLYYRLFRSADFRYMERRPEDKGGWLLHGHRHSNPESKVRGKQIDVGVDAWNYKPVSLQQIESIIGREK